MRLTIVCCVVLILAAGICIPVTGAQPPAPDFEKILQIHMNYQGNVYTVSSMEVSYGKAPNLNIRSGILEGTILDSNGHVLKSFSFQKPGTTYGDSVGPDNNMVGYTETPGSGEMSITIPYVQDMQKLTLTDSTDGAVLASVDLDPPVTPFCTDYPNDPDCLSQVSPAPSAEAQPINNPGTMLVLASLFSASVFLMAGIAIWTIRRRTMNTGPEKRVVLIVDDDPDIVNIIDIFLSQKGFATIRAASGKECLASLGKRIPDMILLDVRMEPMDGWQTLGQIKKNPGTKSIPVLMLTGDKLSAETAKRYNLCIDDYIAKPFKLDELHAAVEGIIIRQQRLKETLDLAAELGIAKDKLYELARLSRYISVNRKIIDLMGVPRAIPVQAELETLDDMLLVDYINLKTKDHEKRANELRHEINAALRSKGHPDLNW